MLFYRWSYCFLQNYKKIKKQTNIEGFIYKKLHTSLNMGESRVKITRFRPLSAQFVAHEGDGGACGQFA